MGEGHPKDSGEGESASRCGLGEGDDVRAAGEGKVDAAGDGERINISGCAQRRERTNHQAVPPPAHSIKMLTKLRF